MSTDIDVTKLKVPELRAELGKRGLNTFGPRQVLVDRLNEALGVANQSDAPSSEFTADADEPPCITSPIQNKSSCPDNMQDGSTRRQSFENGIADAASDANADSESRLKGDGELKRRRSPSGSPRRRSRSRDRDSRRSPRRRSASPSAKNRMSEENVGWENSVSVFLDTYNCDLSLMIDAEGYHAKPLTNGGFSMMWAGVRANYGLISGKAFFEVKNVRHLPVENLDSMSGGAAHVMRVGWSTENSEFALGEEPQSFGYGGTGKKSCDNKFSNYGCTFGEGDVVGAFLEWTTNEAAMRFSVNGVDQGECYRIPKNTLGERYALFPHIYVKNVEFTVNFGQDGQPPWFPPNIPNSDPMSWQLLNNINIASRVHGRMPPASKAECEVLMMMGLPGAGKTYYADHLRADNREMQYNVLGTNLILDKMKVMGLARQRNYHGRWDVLIDQATKCLNQLISIASMRRRHYILDQTNVYPTAQRRKMRPFEGFKRKAIVIVPTDEEFRRRIAQREKEEGKEVPESAVLEMKANFGIPKPLSEDSSSVFDEVIFTELNSTEARELVRKYNQEGQANRPPPEKRQRWDGGRDSSDSRDSRFRGGYDGRDRGRDFGRGRRDDFRRSPSRRDDRGRREYRGGYNANRDRSHEEDRYDRSRERDSYGRSSDDRYGGPGGRFGGPPGRGFPPGMGPGGYGSRGGPMMMRGGRGGPSGNGMTRGYGGPGFDGSGAPMEFRGSGDGRPPRGGRGGFRGGPPSSGGYGGPMEPMYGAPPSRFDAAGPKASGVDVYGSGDTSYPSGPEGHIPPEASHTAGGYRGGYGPPPHGSYGAPDSGGYGVPPGRAGRGGNPMDRDSAPPTRGAPPVRGAPFQRGGPTGRGGFPPASRGGYQSDQEPPGYSATNTDRPQPSYSTYPAGGALGGSGPGNAVYPGEEYSGRSRTRFSGGDTNSSGSYAGAPPQPKQSVYTGPAGYPGGYQRGGSSAYSGGEQTGYPSSGGGYPTDTSSGYPAGGYPGSDSYQGPGGADAGARGARPGARMMGGPQAGLSSYGSSDPAKSVQGAQPPEQQPDGSSLYASGAARYGESRPGQSVQPTPPKQSRFDSKPPTQQPYSGYPPGSYPGSYGSGYGTGPSSGSSAAPQSTTQPSGLGGARPGRSRFDLGPGAGQPTSAPVPSGTTAVQPQQSSQQQQAQQPSQSTQPYGYAYPPTGSKPDAGVGQQSAASQQYASYSYGYGGYGAYPQAPQSQTSQNRQASTASSTPSLYASAVADKPQTASQPPAAQPAANSAAAAAAAAYASYYGYSSAAPGTTTTAPGAALATQQSGGKYDAAMAAAQQFNAWQQQPPPSTPTTATATPATTASTQSAAAGASSTAAYAGYYPGYSAYGAGYGSTNPTSGTQAPGQPTSAMPQYYGGFR
ncbi:Heteroproteinous nuclear ribonucleoprotein U-like protein 1 [Clonorchis sinensis]|uniref:Heteroproteinous nuclear ribonucleoprotein U-like protein 1 n=1 Tax=Clonorchis sinensis TaxID=79923 RepID=A0A3R7JKZ6_CLOSI|nr:Heteroproteinous nuclear ribonucleoprotein U-like protein 1 [Clonorchis sinensis]